MNRPLTAVRRPLRADAALMLALGGCAALAAAMGLGRFLFTPVLPMMAAGTGLTPSQGGLIAAANFAGYLAGALLASLPGLSARGRTGLLLGLAVSGIAMAGMALPGGVAVWAALRFVGGVASAMVLVMASSLVVQRLAAAGRADLVPLHFAGVGIGVALSAVIAAPAFAADGAWSQVWLSGAVLTGIALLIAVLLIPAPPATVAPISAAGPPSPARQAEGLWRLVVSYGCHGFGYVITATFLVAILRDGPGGRWAEAGVWFAVGLAAIPSVAVWAWVSRRRGPVVAWQAAMLVEASGVALSALASGTLALVLAAVALGGTFMGLTAMGLQEAARRSGGADGRAIMGLMTAAFGLGQVAGPLVAGWLREATGTYTAPSLIAAAVLVAGAVLVHPLHRRGAP